MPLVCKNCKKNYCLKHRHENDHKCEGEVKAESGLNNKARNRYYLLNLNLFFILILYFLVSKAVLMTLE